MAADFMGHPAPLHNSLSVLLFVLIASCNNTSSDSNKLILNSAEGNLQMRNGILFHNEKLFTGTVYTLYPNKKDTAEIAGFLDGKENGIRKRFYPGGKLKEIREFENGNKTGTYLAWWENGRKKLEYHFKDDEYEGTCREWNAEGRLIQEMNYKKGYEEGAQKMFYDNGKVRSNYIMMNGRRYGLLGTKNCVNVSDSVFKN